MAKKTSLKRKKDRSLSSGLTYTATEFRSMCKKKPHRIGIVAEGDSWFAYPRKWIAAGPDTNIIHHIADKVADTDKVNLLRLASNGDEAVNMTSGKQMKALYKILKNNREHIKIVLFSGGGNDIVGRDDMLPLLHEYEEGMTALDCVNAERFQRKLESIMLAYHRLIDLCSDIVPDAKIVTHTYDIPKPENSGAEFFWGLIKTKPWVYPYLKRKKIPGEFHLPIMQHMLGNFAQELIKLGAAPATRDHIVVVDTQGTLRPGHNTDWLNEIHPSRAGFKRVSKKIYRQMREINKGLPAW
jgi:hypothetical protein